MTRKPKPPRRRNPLHDHPLLKKGGKHEKPRKAERRKDKVKTGRLEED